MARLLYPAIAVLALFLLAPVAQAHGSFHGQAFPRQFEVATEARSGNNTVIDVLYQWGPNDPGTFETGDLFILSGRSDGPGDMQVSLRRTTDGSTSTVVAIWTYPGDGETYVRGALLPGAGEYSLVIETAHSDWTSFSFQFDHSDLRGADCNCGQRWISPRPPMGAGLFTVEATESGPYRATLTEPAASELRVEVYEADRSNAAWPTDFTRLDISTNPGGTTDPMVHTLDWDATAATRYYIVATGIDDDGFSNRPAPPEAQSPWHAIFDAGPDASAGVPGPSVLVVLAALAVAALRTSRP